MPAKPDGPAGLKPPPRRVPRRMRSTADLRVVQRLMIHAIVRPFTPDGRPSVLPDGRTAAAVAAEIIRPNDRLTSSERLDIYHRMYWYRLIEAVTEDSPGLRAVLGARRFDRLARAYLAKYPSRSFTLRNLCSRLSRFIREEPRATAPWTALAYDVARFEWAQTVAFDGEARPVPEPNTLAATHPSRLRLGLQPYLSLLALDHPVDDYVIAVKKRDALRTEASNAIHGSRAARRIPRVTRPRRKRTYLAVHRLNNTLYYKRLDRVAFRILSALGEGRTVARAVLAGGPRLRPAQVREWFATWMKLGWICVPPP